MKKLLVLMVTVIFLLTASIAVAADVTFRWDANTETDLAKYKLYQTDTPGQYTKAQVIGEGNLVAIMLLADIADPANPEYTLTDVADGQHYWVLTAADLTNNESGFSNEVTDTIDTTPPAPPGGLSIWEIIIAWIKSLFGWA